MFKYYRKEGCLYECKLQYASQMTGCIPWDYPTNKNISDFGICTTDNEEASLEDFDMHMESDDALVDCNCEENCEEVSYHTEVSQKEFFIEYFLQLYSFLFFHMMFCWQITRIMWE